MPNNKTSQFLMNPAAWSLPAPIGFPATGFPYQQNPLLPPNLKLGLPPFFQQPNMLGNNYGGMPAHFRGLYGNPRVGGAADPMSDHHDNGEPDDANAEVENQELWQKFSDLNTEMVITKTGRYDKNVNNLFLLLNLYLTLVKYFNW